MGDLHNFSTSWNYKLPRKTELSKKGQSQILPCYLTLSYGRTVRAWDNVIPPLTDQISPPSRASTQQFSLSLSSVLPLYWIFPYVWQHSIVCSILKHSLSQSFPPATISFLLGKLLKELSILWPPVVSSLLFSLKPSLSKLNQRVLWAASDSPGRNTSDEW